MDGRKSVRVDNLSKLTTIEELREKLSSDFDATPDKQRLFYRGKQARRITCVLLSDVISTVFESVTIWSSLLIILRDSRCFCPITHDTHHISLAGRWSLFVRL